MKIRILLGLNIILCMVCLFISCRIFWNMGIFVDEYNLSPDIVVGGDIWLMMDWLRLFLLFIILMFSAIIFFFLKRVKKDGNN